MVWAPYNPGEHSRFGEAPPADVTPGVTSRSWSGQHAGGFELMATRYNEFHTGGFILGLHTGASYWPGGGESAVTVAEQVACQRGGWMDCEIY